MEVCFAGWPDEETWQRAFDAKMVYDDPETRRLFVDAIAESAPNGAPVFAMHVPDDDTVKCWGSNNAGQLAGGT